MKTEFKEKTYEQYFNSELNTRNIVFYSPDQVDENHLGFDAAFRAPLRRLLSLLFSHGCHTFYEHSMLGMLRGARIAEVNEWASDVADRMPPFKFNLFVQYKRPEFLNTSRAAQWAFWKKPYFRYNITEHQQKTLEKLEIKSQGRAAVLYASPAFWDTSTLWKHVKKRKVIKNSNIVRAGQLQGHSKYTYSSAGSLGIGHSEPEHIESISFEEIIRVGQEQYSYPFKRHIEKNAATILNLLEEDEGARFIFMRVQSALLIEDLSDGSFFSALNVIHVFCLAFDVNYYAVG
ncbi:hypothetical protein [Polycladidibacter hongkongensis]|uniref:hypothetical protein n=1 Tax=Polycladidibacter hongkongensis TaxID=1647556 RepID=UPI0008364168|nr:hypothetical protein [Pseudovibrio hongkongensis]